MLCKGKSQTLKHKLNVQLLVLLTCFVGQFHIPLQKDEFSPFCVLNSCIIVLGVELFFNVPLHQFPSRFTYHTVKVMAEYQIINDSSQSTLQVECNYDFLGQMKVFLKQGWKLVDICIDNSAISECMSPLTKH